MSRDRPTTLPRAVPSRAANETRTERRARQALELRNAQSGPAVFGATIASPRARRAPQFIRRGYEAGIVDELNAFYSRRPRPWRMAHCQAGQTHKERLNAQRGGRHMKGPGRA